MVPVVVMWHLCVGQPALCLVREVQVAAYARMLLQALQDAKHVRDPEATMVDGAQDLCGEVPSNMIDEILQPMVLIGVPRQRVPGPVVDRVQVLPEPGVDVVSSMAPVHAEGHDVVVQSELRDPDGETVLHVLRRGVVARQAVVHEHAEGELAQHRHPIVQHQPRQLDSVTATQVFAVNQRVIARRLCAVLRESKVARLEVRIVHPRHDARAPEERRHLQERHAAPHVHGVHWKQDRCRGQANQERQLHRRAQQIAAEQQVAEMLRRADVSLGDPVNVVLLGKLLPLLVVASRYRLTVGDSGQVRHGSCAVSTCLRNGPRWTVPEPRERPVRRKPKKRWCQNDFS
mmetsp:Transcript_47918/g.129241  ORF Transcript_47918/g.129241 Transcript_47918/m.129241 type:complete len:345 (-) Transcript_47918:24-1058(-)